MTCIHAGVGQGAGVVVGNLHQMRRHGPLLLRQALAQLMQRHLHAHTHSLSLLAPLTYPGATQSSPTQGA